MARGDGQLLNGQLYLPEDDLEVPFTEQMRYKDTADAMIGDAKTEITPQDAASSQVRVYDYEAISDALDAYFVSFPGTVNVDLPDILEAITVTYNKSIENGRYTERGEGFSNGTYINMSLASSGTAEGSASVLPDVQLSYRQIWGRNIPCTHYLFYHAGNITRAQVLTRLSSLAGSTVSEWPVFKPAAHTITLNGQQVQVSSRANVQQRLSQTTGESGNTTFTKAVGAGTSRGGGVTIRTVRIPPMIHKQLTISNPRDQAQCVAYAAAGWPEGTNWPKLISQPPPLLGLVKASVTPTSFPATSPSSIPTSGLYLMDTNVNLYKWGYNRVHAIVLDAVNFA